MVFNTNIKLHLIILISCIFCCLNIAAKTSKIDSLTLVEKSLQNDSSKVITLNKIADLYMGKDYIKSINYAKKGLRLSRLIGYKKGTLNSLTTLANAYDYIGDYSKSQKLNFQILEIYERENDLEGINTMYNNIGIIHYYLGNYKQAIEFTTKALNYYQNINDSIGISMCYNNIANSYSDEGENEKALSYYFKALTIYEAINDSSGISLINGNVGEVYIEEKKYAKAFQFLSIALQVATNLKDTWQQANMYNSIGDLYYRENKSNQAIEYLLKALEINKKLGVKAEIGEVYSNISKAYEQKGNYEKSLHYLKLGSEVNNELFTKDNAGKIAEMNALYEINEKEKELLRQEAISSSQKTQKKALIVGSLIGFLLLFIIVGISVKGNINKRKSNDKLELQKKQIEAKNRDITDSILYAKRIQSAIFPSSSLLKNHLENSFTLYLPKDIVAGDFYWMDLSPINNNSEDTVLFAAADCTGHGVPGAMVSVVCHNALNRAVREFKLSEPAKILDKVTQLVIETFEQGDDSIKDGMDIALCSLNTKTNELEFSGANNSLYIIRDKELIETKPDKQPIGKYMLQKPFTNHKQTLKKGDQIYLFTDGYADQFGGEKGKKLKYKEFKRLLIENSNKSMSEQLTILTNHFNSWKGELEQIDDVCVLGVRV
ncbi:MAG: tetratricopeptide repeat protein [Vicingaceae bacterium]